jgi:hypothetical protein
MEFDIPKEVLVGMAVIIYGIVLFALFKRKG